MDKKNINRTYIICNIIMAVLLVISFARTVYVQKMNTAIQQEIIQENDRAENITAEIKQQVDRQEKIYGDYTDALERNTASNERLILFLKQMNQEAGRCAQ